MLVWIIPLGIAVLFGAIAWYGTARYSDGWQIFGIFGGIGLTIVSFFVLATFSSVGDFMYETGRETVKVEHVEQAVNNRAFVVRTADDELYSLSNLTIKICDESTLTMVSYDDGKWWAGNPYTEYILCKD